MNDEKKVFTFYFSTLKLVETRKNYKDHFTGLIIPAKSKVWRWKETRYSTVKYSMRKPITKEDMYYMQNGWSGNFPRWWQRSDRSEYDEGCGYSTDIKQAALFTKEGAKKQVDLGRGEVAFPCIAIDFNNKCKKVVVDLQYVEHENKIVE